MDLVGLYLANPFWWWVAAAAILLTIEVATGSEVFLWPAVAAGVLAVLSASGVRLPLGADLALFAVLTIAGALVAKKVRPPPAMGPDINDPLHRLVGLKGTVVSAFDRGRGRVLVEGSEWGADTDSDAALIPGDRVLVEAIIDGGRLKVRQG
jgi:membrane protein implicated in regulation of membrane protease activity